MDLMKNAFRTMLRKSGLAVHKLKSPPYGVCAMADIHRYSPQPIRMFFDVGANIGQTTQEVLEWFPEATVFAFEPIAPTYRKLRERFASVTRVQCYEVALGASNGETTVYLKGDSQQNSLNPHLNAPTENAQKVIIESLDYFAQQHAIDFIDVLKMDTENFEIPILKGGDSLLKNQKVGFVYAEIGLSASDHLHTPLQELSEMLGDYGFELMGIYERLYHHLKPRVRSWANALFIHRSMLD